MVYFYLLKIVEYEWQDMVLLMHTNKKDLNNDVKKCAKEILPELLGKEGFIGLDDILKKLVEKLVEKYGYSIVKPDDAINIHSTSIDIYVDNKDNRKILGEEVSKKIWQHNKELEHRLMEEALEEDDEDDLIDELDKFIGESAIEDVSE